MFHAACKGNLDILHAKEVVNLKSTVVDAGITRKHYADVVAHRFDPLWQRTCDVSDAASLDKRIRLARNVKDT